LEKNGRKIFTEKRKEIEDNSKERLQEKEERAENAEKKKRSLQGSWERDEKKWKSIEICTSSDELRQKFCELTYTQKKILLEEQAWVYRRDVDTELVRKSLPVKREGDLITDEEMLENIAKVIDMKKGRPVKMKRNACLDS
jgi:hypothetical protein